MKKDHAKQQYEFDSKISGNKITIVYTNLRTKETQKATKTINDPTLLARVNSVIHLPAEEYDFGLYDKDCTLRQFLNSVVKNQQDTTKLEKSLVLKHKSKKEQP